MASVALVFPPVWYYSAIPTELTWPAATLSRAGHSVALHDLNLAAWSILWEPERRALAEWTTYTEPGALDRVCSSLAQRGRVLSDRFGAHIHARGMTFPDADMADAVAIRRRALDPRRNPLLPLLDSTARRLSEEAPDHVGLALGYPDQRPHLLALAARLRHHGYAGRIWVYGGLSDQLAPLDLAPDLVGTPRHVLFDHVDGVLLGDAGPALVAAAEGRDIPGLLTPDAPVPSLSHTPLIRHDGYTDWSPPAGPYPSPLVDVRLGRGCPWARCTFCAIQAHQPAYRAGPLEDLVDTVRRAHEAWGSRYFRLRDDLLTPRQLDAVAEGLGSLPGAPRWSARARLQPGFTKERLRRAQEAGLSELWVGLESASERVRERMDKGVDSRTVTRVLDAARDVGLRVRLLCLVGFPGETAEERRATMDLIARRHELESVSISSFLPMRRSPMAAEPGAWGLTLVGDSLPRQVRLRHTLPAQWSPSGREVMADMIHLRMQVGERLMRAARPDPAHGWLRSDVSVREKP